MENSGVSQHNYQVYLTQRPTDKRLTLDPWVNIISPVRRNIMERLIYQVKEFIMCK